MERRWSSLVSTAVTSAAAVAIAVLGTACAENPVGRKCFIGGEVGANEAVIASPALECPSGQCLQVPLSVGQQLPEGGEFTAQCTGECEVDDDCDRVPESPCVTGFTCGIPTVVGPFCCRKLCICKDYLPEGEELRVPEACDPEIEANKQTCANL